ncbi:type II and III secretion system protein family protein [Leptothrix sp. BB-4]
MATHPVFPSTSRARPAIVAALSAALMLAFAPGSASAQDPACVSLGSAPIVRLALGKSTVVRPREPVARILLGNPDHSRAGRPAEPEGKAGNNGANGANGTHAMNVQQAGNNRAGAADIDVLLLSSSEIYLLGKSLGSTNVVMIDRKGGCTAFDVVVDMDTVALKSVIEQLLPEERDIKVTAAFDTIVLSGSVSDAEALTRVTDLANAFVRGAQGNGGNNAGNGNGNGNGGGSRVVNMLSVAAPQQVMLDVKVAEVSKALVDKFGVNLASSITNGSWTPGISSGFGSGGSGALLGSLTGKLSGNITVDGQKDDGQVRVLAEPSIMAVSGQTGSFLAGGKIFIPVSQTNSAGGREVTLEEKEFGVSLKFTPTVLGGGRINLKVRPEVSELSREGVTLASSGGGTAILPSLTSRKAETTVQLMDGQSFAIGGLIKNNTSTNVKAFPFLGEIPVLGALFRSSQFQNDQTELVFVVTPHLVKPLPVGYVLPTDLHASPTRTDRLLQGQVDRPVSPPQVDKSRGGFDAPKN